MWPQIRFCICFYVLRCNSEIALLQSIHSVVAVAHQTTVPEVVTDSIPKSEKDFDVCFFVCFVVVAFFTFMMQNMIGHEMLHTFDNPILLSIRITLPSVSPIIQLSRYKQYTFKINHTRCSMLNTIKCGIWQH